MFVPTLKQKEQLDILNDHNYQYNLFFGGAGSGKTYSILRWLLWQCYQYKAVNGGGLNIGIVRNTNAEVSKNIFGSNFPDVLQMEGWSKVKRVEEYKWHEKVYQTNVTDLSIMFPTGAKIFCSGMDTQERLEKVLGITYGHLYFNEVSNINFYSYELLKTRLRQKCSHITGKAKFTPKIILDCNPPEKTHWVYSTFFEGVKPDKSPIPSFHRYKYLQMNPDSNWDNLDENYKDVLNEMSGKRRERFLLGVFQDSGEFALWQPDMIERNRIHPDFAPAMKRVVVAVDPAMSATESSDKTGIIVAGSDDNGHYYIMNDSSFRGLPHEWGDKVIQLYERYMADAIVAETNQGGMTVVETITNAARSRNITIPHIYTVHAKRAKYLRAEPISILYNENKVHHLFYFDELERQMLSYTGEPGKESPNNLDALVYAIIGAKHTNSVSTLDYSLRA